MRNIFSLPFSFWAPLLVVLLGVSLVFYFIVFNNLSSKDVVFSFTALAAALMLFYLNVCLGLKEEKKEHVTQIHMVVSNSCVLDVFSEKNSKSNFVVFNRDNLSRARQKFLKKFKCGDSISIPESFTFTDGELQETLNFYLISSLLGELLMSFPDWKQSEQKFVGGSNKSFNNSQEGAGGNAFYSRYDLDVVMANKIDSFSLVNSIAISARGLTLPPNTKITKNKSDLVFDNSFVRIEFKTVVQNRLTRGIPTYRDNGQLVIDQQQEVDVINLYANIVTSVIYKKDRFGNLDMPKYKEWVDHLVGVVKDGFEPI